MPVTSGFECLYLLIGCPFLPIAEAHVEKIFNIRRGLHVDKTNA